MRRFFSIAAIVALLCSMMPAELAMSCHGKAVRMMCHRVTRAAHHCGMMHEQEQSSDEGSGSRMSVLEQAPKCPMNCCLHSGARNGAAIAVHFGNYQQPVAEHSFVSTRIVFTSNGFSSHTDRGPPTA